MIVPDLYSIRMRASASRSHLSGAERLVPGDRIDLTVSELVRRARSKQVAPDQIVVTIDALGAIPVHAIPSLDLFSLTERDAAACRHAAVRALAASGVSLTAVETAFRILDQGAAPGGGSMRGAMIMDAASGERLEPDRSRGLRVTRFDWNDEASAQIDRELSRLGLTHFRTKEALALASKVCGAPGVVAELCWSDDADYTAGYVASRTQGYIRFPVMKQMGVASGGRVFFVIHAGLDMNTLVSYLQDEPVLITSIGKCQAADVLSSGAE